MVSFADGWERKQGLIYRTDKIGPGLELPQPLPAYEVRGQKGKPQFPRPVRFFIDLGEGDEPPVIYKIVHEHKMPFLGRSLSKYTLIRDDSKEPAGAGPASSTMKPAVRGCALEVASIDQMTSEELTMAAQIADNCYISIGGENLRKAIAVYRGILIPIVERVNKLNDIHPPTYRQAAQSIIDAGAIHSLDALEPELPEDVQNVLRQDTVENAGREINRITDLDSLGILLGLWNRKLEEGVKSPDIMRAWVHTMTRLCDIEDRPPEGFQESPPFQP